MSAYELRSDRLNKQANSGKAAVYEYDELSQKFRTQVLHILKEAVGVPNNNREGFKPISKMFWDIVRNKLIEDKGLLSLQGVNEVSEDCLQYIMKAATDDALDIIELAFYLLPHWQKQHGIMPPVPGIREKVEDPRQTQYLFADGAIALLNRRFAENDLGYEFINGEIVRKDSEYIHAETTVPAIYLLHDANFKGASDEFFNAQKHYKNGLFKESSVDALKALESTIKSICNEMGWGYAPTDTASKLIKIVFDQGLLPSYLDNQLTSLRMLLESGAPTIRNKTSGHGQGIEVVPVPRYVAAYALHLAAASIVFLVEAYKELKSKPTS